MFRFLTLALPLILALVAGGQFLLGALGWAPTSGLPARTIFGGWLLEAVGLTALFLLIHARGLNRYVAGLAAGWTAWLFRGPVLVVAVVGASRLTPAAWWRMTWSWFLLYTICGLVLGSITTKPLEPPPKEPLPWPDEPSS